MSIYDQVLAFIAAPDAARFEELALEVFRHQVANVAAYREHCRRLRVRENSITRIEDIPPVSTLAFKYARLARDEHTAGEKIFLTSGTTIGRSERGTHIVAHPEIYRASALAHLKTMMFPDDRKMRILAMHPTADRMPESSLSQMITWCIEEFGAGPCECVADRKGVDTAAACDFLERCGARRRAGVHPRNHRVAGSAVRASGALRRSHRARTRIANHGHRRREGTSRCHSKPTRYALARAEMLGIAPALGHQRIRDDRTVLAALRRDIVQFG